MMLFYYCGSCYNNNILNILLSLLNHIEISEREDWNDLPHVLALSDSELLLLRLDKELADSAGSLSVRREAESTLLVQQLQDIWTGSFPQRNQDLSLVLALPNVSLPRGHEYLPWPARSLEAGHVAPPSLLLYQEGRVVTHGLRDGRLHVHPTGQAGAEDDREQVQTGHVGGSLNNPIPM